MKRLWSAAVFSVLLIIICWVGIHYINQYSDGTIKRLEIAEQAAQSGDVQKAVKAAEDVENYWKSAEKVLNLFVNHSDLSEIGLSVTKLAPLIENDDLPSFLAEINTARVQIIHISEMESWSNFN